jgi:hypothetical protein
MLALSIEYESKAREYYGGVDSVTTLFLIEHGADKKVLELIDKYPFKKEIIHRQEKMGLTKNILEGMTEAFDRTDSFIIYVEDDILLHKTYFNYMKVLMQLIPQGTYSVLASFNKDDVGDVHKVFKGHHYAALAPIITKKFFNTYIYPCANADYYNNPPRFVTKLNEKYKEYWGKKYKYKDTTHYEQAGLINRLVDVALIEEDMCVIIPYVNRQQHIGYFGKNRPGGLLPGNNYKERLKNLRSIITDADKMYEMSAAKQYNDYKVFSPKLDKWDGTLSLK